MTITIDKRGIIVIALILALLVVGVMGWPVQSAISRYRSTYNSAEKCTAAGEVSDAWARVGFSGKAQEWNVQQDRDCNLAALKGLAG